MPNILLAVLFIVIVASTAIAHTSHTKNHLTNDENSNNTAVAPHFKKKLLPYIVKPVGNMVRFRCPAHGNPEPNITWYKDGKTPIIRQLDTILTMRASIILEDLLVSDAGNYTCNVCNSMGCVNFTYKLEVLDKSVERANTKPIFVTIPQNQTVIYGQDCNFTCHYLSDLHSYLQWLVVYRDSRNKTIVNPASPEILQLYNVTFEDEGWYTCIASNSLGNSHASAYLKVMPC